LLADGSFSPPGDASQYSFDRTGFRVFGGMRWLTPATVKELRTRSRAFPESLVRRAIDGAPFDWDKRVID
jgi:hypothetical protein